jgi:N-acetylglucosamine kinase-like BadF-type ATPase
VLRAAEDGDLVAMSIVTATGEHLGKSAAVVASRLQLEPGYDLVLAGGLFRSSSQLLRSTLLEQVPGVRVVNLTAPPAAGAVVLALEEQGVKVDKALHGRVLEGASAVLPGSSA